MWVGTLVVCCGVQEPVADPCFGALYACRSRVAKFPYSAPLPTNNVDDHDDNNPPRPGPTPRTIAANHSK